MKRAAMLALVLAACSPQAPPQPPPAAPEPAVATPQVVTLRITFAQNGQTAEAAVGQAFSIELPGEEALGLVWRVEQTPDFISPAAEGTATIPSESAPPGAPGETGRSVFFFVANAPGAGDIVLRQRGFDGSADPAGAVFRVTINAR